MIVSLPIVSALLAVILPLGLHVNLSASAPRGLYRTGSGRPTRGAWVVACVGPAAAARTRTRLSQTWSMHGRRTASAQAGCRRRRRVMEIESETVTVSS